MHKLDQDWFVEAHEYANSAIGFKVKKLLHSEKTPFQTIDIYETTDWGNLMVLDGCAMVTTRDNFLYHEMISHPAMFTHPRAKRVVIIGGGDCGTLREVLKHEEVESVVQCDIDERVTRLAERYFPELCASNNDPRAKIMFDDGVKLMAEMEADSVDLIIVDSTDPIGPAEGLFNQAFYVSCLKSLRAGGILVQQSESPLIHTDILLKMRTQMKGSGFGFLKTVCFPQPCYPSGWWSVTMARKGIDLNNFRERGAATKKFETKYYNVDTHRAGLATPEFLKSIIGEA